MVYTFNPLGDPRWEALCQRHPRASIFHTTGWLEALRSTYGYEPVVCTTCPPATELTHGVVFCRVRDWLTGQRMVSLPFSDHCEPLVDNPEQWTEVCAFLERALEGEKLRYIEVRHLSANLPALVSLHKGESFCFHTLDLRPSCEDLFRRTHKSSVQRRIRRAEREALTYEEGSSEALLDKFYGLLVITRKRHNMPPQPIAWFRNLLVHLRDRLTIRVASYQHKPVGGILTLRHRDTVVYKYGSSDARYHYLGVMPFLLWRAIQAAKHAGMRVFDFGRSDTTNRGLIRFKDNWGTFRSMLSYGRFGAEVSDEESKKRLVTVARLVLPHMPDGLFTAAGKLIYRHIA